MAASGHLPLPEAAPVPAPRAADPRPQTRPDAPAPLAAPRELTLRAVLLGCAIGAVLAAGNVYTGLKTSFIDGGSITAAVLGFTFFATFRRRGGLPYSALENNITQTTAASAAVMGFVLGTSGSLPALAMMGRTYPAWQLCVWGIALGLLGIFLAAALRKKLILKEALPFPTGVATAEVIETIYAAREAAVHRARLLVGAGLFAMYITWLRDGQPAILPQVLALPLSIAGVSAAALTVGISWSPLLASTGVFMGLRNAASMLLGGGVTWLVLAPWLLRRHIVQTPSYSAFVAWLVWPGVGLMMGSAFTMMAIDRGSALRSLRDLKSLLRRRPRRDGPPAAETAAGRLPFQKTLVLASVAALVVIGRSAFGLHPALTLLALSLSVVLAGVCARAAGETDIAPIGSVGMLTQLVFGGYGVVTSLVTGAITAGDASQTAQTLWALKAGQRLKASVRAQLGGQIIGAVVGGLVVVPVYYVITQTYRLGSEAMPAASALSWKATAEAVRGGFSAMPAGGPQAGAIGFALGVALCLIGRTAFGRFVPSPTALGMSVLTPASLSATAFLGALAAALVKRRWPKISDGAIASIAAGGIAGESIMGVLIALLAATGLL
jgi:putative OPT family oligopeptide transporter